MWRMSFLNKVTGPGPNGDQYRVPDDTRFKKDLPALWEYMTAQTYPDGRKRKTATVTLFLGPQGCQASLNDRDNARSIFAAGATFDESLERLDELAQDEDTVWRHDRNLTGSSARKKE